VIAAVVVGGTSLAGGEGQILGTLIGALIIGVIRNGMNLMNVEPYTQKVMLGLGDSGGGAAGYVEAAEDRELGTHGLWLRVEGLCLRGDGRALIVR